MVLVRSYSPFDWRWKERDAELRVAAGRVLEKPPRCGEA
jgi:hypothetical protein